MLLTDHPELDMITCDKRNGHLTLTKLVELSSTVSEVAWCRKPQTPHHQKFQNKEQNLSKLEQRYIISE